MAILDESKRLKKDLSLLNIYSIATGATIASGFATSNDFNTFTEKFSRKKYAVSNNAGNYR